MLILRAREAFRNYLYTSAHLGQTWLAEWLWPQGPSPSLCPALLLTPWGPLLGGAGEGPR